MLAAGAKWGLSVFFFFFLAGKGGGVSPLTSSFLFLVAFLFCLSPSLWVMA